MNFIPPEENESEQLCVNCLAPNETNAHFCEKCGAPLTSYAATGPFEHIFAEGHVYREAAEKPRCFIVVLGIWLIFGAVAFAGIGMFIAGRNITVRIFPGGFFIIVSLVMIWKTARNYFVGRRTGAS